MTMSEYLKIVYEFMSSYVMAPEGAKREAVMSRFIDVMLDSLEKQKAPLSEAELSRLKSLFRDVLLLRSAMKNMSDALDFYGSSFAPTFVVSRAFRFSIAVIDRVCARDTRILDCARESGSTENVPN